MERHEILIGKTHTRYCVQDGKQDGSVQITRIAPYDETEYHWALKRNGESTWRIIRKGKVESRVPANAYTETQVASICYDFDTRDHLTRRGGIW